MARKMKSNFILKKIKLLRSPPNETYLLKRLSYNDIKKATDGFRRNINNYDGDKAIYRAKFPNGDTFIVKEFTQSSDDGDNNKAFYNHLQLLARLHHRHILTVYGFSTGHKNFFIFENLENGSLKDHLSDPLKTPLNWRTRLQITVSVAAALEYLHFFCEPPVYHISINSNSILLDDNFTAKLSNMSLVSPPTNHDPNSNSFCSKESECTSETCKKMMFELGLVILELVTGQCSGNGGVDLISMGSTNWFPQIYT